MTTTRLEAPANAEHAAIIRRFVAGLGDVVGLSRDVAEDLKLAASEIFGDLVQDGGDAAVTISTQPGLLELRFEGTRQVDGASVSFAVVQALFENVGIEGGAVVLRIPLSDG